MLILGLANLVVLFIRKNIHNDQRPDSEHQPTSDLILLLLPLSPVVRYILANRTNTSLIVMAVAIGVFTLLSALYVILIPWFLRKISPTRLTIALGLAYIFTITSMASLSSQFNWYHYGSIIVQGPVLVGTFLLALFLGAPNLKPFLYILCASILVVNITSQVLNQPEQILTQAPDNAPSQNNQFDAVIGDRLPTITPNVYLLVYDAYAPNETMSLYDIDNRDQIHYLKQHGFTL